MYFKLIWSFKRKRLPDGSITKYKARLCAHGGMQRWGIDYWETFAPVVNWIIVRTLLTLAHVHGLESRSIDFVLAFPQARLTTDVYMELPFGFKPPRTGNYVLKLKKNLYGLKDAALNWFKYLSDGLESKELQFNKSEIDQCVFLRNDLIVLVYVDDVILISRESSAIDKVINRQA